VALSSDSLPHQASPGRNASDESSQWGLFLPNFVPNCREVSATERNCGHGLAAEGANRHAQGGTHNPPRGGSNPPRPTEEAPLRRGFPCSGARVTGRYIPRLYPERDRESCPEHGLPWRGSGPALGARDQIRALVADRRRVGRGPTRRLLRAAERVGVRPEPFPGAEGGFSGVRAAFRPKRSARSTSSPVVDPARTLDLNPVAGMSAIPWARRKSAPGSR
jgi:hypothetical protein